MNWFRENRFLGAFLAISGLAALGALWFLFMAKRDWDEASARFNNTATESNRLERLSPYPNGENLRKMKAHAENYSNTLAKLRDELKTRVAPATPMAPNEFQSHLRVAMTAVADKARANKVKLPDKFYLGFDEFASALPNEAAVPLLGQELVQIEWLLNSLLDARVEAVTGFRRSPPPDGRGAILASPTPAPATIGARPAGSLPAGAKSFERNVVEASFLSTPAAARKVINQIAGASRHFCIIRLLHVRNEKGKGPPREVAGETAAVAPATAPARSAGAKPMPGTALNFIIGNERVETTAKIEIVRFTF